MATSSLLGFSRFFILSFLFSACEFYVDLLPACNSGILEKSMVARNRVGIRLFYRPARLHRLTGRYDDLVPTRFLAPVDYDKIQALVLHCFSAGTGTSCDCKQVKPPLTVNIYNISVNTHMKREGSSFFSSSTGAHPTTLAQCTVPELDPDPDLHWSEKLDPDPTWSDADPQPCNQLLVFLFLLGMVWGSGGGDLGPAPAGQAAQRPQGSVERPRQHAQPPPWAAGGHHRPTQQPCDRDFHHWETTTTG